MFYYKTSNKIDKLSYLDLFYNLTKTEVLKNEV